MTKPLNKGDMVFFNPALFHAAGSNVSADVRRLLDCTSGVLELAIDLMGKRNRWSDVATEMATFVRDRGFSVVENFVGHGIGQQMHEEPQVPNYGEPGRGPRLAEGMVLKGATKFQRVAKTMGLPRDNH